MRTARSEVRLLRDCARSLRIFAQCNSADATLNHHLLRMSDSGRSSLTPAFRTGVRLLAAGATEQEALSAVRVRIPHVRGEALVSTITHVRTFGVAGISVCEALAQQCERDAEQVLQRRTGTAQIRFSMRAIGVVLVGALCIVVAGAARGNLAGIGVAILPALCVAGLGVFAVIRVLRPAVEASKQVQRPDMGIVLTRRMQQSVVVIPGLAVLDVVLNVPPRTFLFLCLCAIGFVIYEWLSARRSISIFESIVDNQICNLIGALHAQVLAGTDLWSAFDAASAACDYPLRNELTSIVIRRQLGGSVTSVNAPTRQQGIVDLIQIIQSHHDSGTSPTAALHALGKWLDDRQGRVRAERSATLAPRLQLIAAFCFVPAVLWVMLVVVARQFSILGAQL